MYVPAVRDKRYGASRHLGDPQCGVQPGQFAQRDLPVTMRSTLPALPARATAQAPADSKGPPLSMTLPSMYATAPSTPPAGRGIGQATPLADLPARHAGGGPRWPPGSAGTYRQSHEGPRLSAALTTPAGALPCPNRVPSEPRHLGQTATTLQCAATACGTAPPKRAAGTLRCTELRLPIYASRKGGFCMHRVRHCCAAHDVTAKERGVEDLHSAIRLRKRVRLKLARSDLEVEFAAMRILADCAGLHLGRKARADGICPRGVAPDPLWAGARL